MEPLQHDPRTKQQIKEALYSHLYNPIQKQFQLRIKAIANKNVVLQRLSHCSFTFRNVFYNCDTSAPPKRANRLFPDLHPEMEQYLKDIKTLNEVEIPYVIGFINQTLNSTNHLCDYLRLLPESTHAPIRSLIATCPCSKDSLSQDKVNDLKIQNASAIKLMQQRMVMNLIL